MLLMCKKKGGGSLKEIKRKENVHISEKISYIRFVFGVDVVRGEIRLCY